jgi:hypothetical protein
MDDNSESRIAQRHVAELSAFFAAHDQWLFGHACVRTRGDRELGLAEGTVHAHLHTAGQTSRRAGTVLPVRPG